MRVGLASSCIATVYGPCRWSTATQELRGRGYQFMRCNIVGTRAGSSFRCREEVPEDRGTGRNPVAERRVPCKTVLEVNDNSGRRIPGRLTFERKELRLKLYASDWSARARGSLDPARRLVRFGPSTRFPFRRPPRRLLRLRLDTWEAFSSVPSRARPLLSTRALERTRHPPRRIDDSLRVMDSKLP